MPLFLRFPYLYLQKLKWCSSPSRYLHMNKLAVNICLTLGTFTQCFTMLFAKWAIFQLYNVNEMGWLLTFRLEFWLDLIWLLTLLLLMTWLLTWDGMATLDLTWPLGQDGTVREYTYHTLSWFQANQSLLDYLMLHV